MTQIPYVLPQLCTYIDRDYFEMLVKRYHAKPMSSPSHAGTN